MPPKPTYEALARQVQNLQAEVDALRETARQFRQAEDALKKSKATLEKEVTERTVELAATNRVLNDEIEQRKQVEAALRKSEQQYRTLVDNSLVGIYTTDLEGRMLYANEALIRMFGYESSEEFMAEGVIKRYRNPADRQFLIDRLAKTGKVDSFEVELVDRKGRNVTAILSGTLEENLITGVLTNITERKAIETALHESEERYRLLVEGNPDAVLCHRGGTILLANPAAVELFGASALEDLIGRDFYSLVHADDAPKLKKRRDQVVQTGDAVPLLTAKFLQIDGKEIDVEVCGALVFLDKIPTVQTVARDISARVRADAALRESEKRLRLLTNHLHEAMVYQLLVKPDGARQFLHVSDTIRQLHGLSPYDVMADPALLYDQVLPEFLDELRARETKSIRDHATFRCELECRLPSGERRWFELVSTPRARADGAVIFDGIDIDITERKKAEQLLLTSQAQFKRLFTHANVGIALHDIVHDAQGRAVDYVLTDVNPAYTRILGLERSTVIGHNASQVYGSDEAPYLDTFAAVAQNGEATAFETYYPPMDRHFRVVAYCPREGSFATIFDDISEMKKAAQVLANSERRLNDIIEFLPDPTWVIDRDGCVIAWNKAVEHLTGVKKEDILGQCDYAHAVPFYGEPRPTLLNLLLQRDRKWEDKYFNLKEENGSLVAGDSFHPLMGDGGRYLSATAAKLYDAQGQIVGAIQSVRDITDAKKSEQERERLIDELKAALAEVRTLSGLLPICAKCKKIRDDRGYWNQIELYIREHTDADFSHGVCPDCARELYPGLDLEFDRADTQKD